MSRKPCLTTLNGAILSDRDIRKLLKSGELKVVPLETSQIKQAGIDLTLSNEWFFIKDSIKAPIRIETFSLEKDCVRIKRKQVVLETGQMCLALTKERINMPDYLIGIMEGRSRFARAGLTVHVTSSIIQPGSNNRQILEMVNLGPKPLLVKEGTRLTHVIFLQLSSPTTKPYKFYSTLRQL